MFWIIVNALEGVVNGTFGLPMKFTVKWRWENTWSMWTIWTLLVVPRGNWIAYRSQTLSGIRRSGFESTGIYPKQM